MPPYRAAMLYMRDVLDKFADHMALDEQPFTVVVRTPNAPLLPRESYEVRAVYDPNPAVEILNQIGLKNGLNGLLYIRESHLPRGLTFITDSDGTIRSGYEFVVRGRMFYAVKMFQDREEIAFLLNDQLEYNDG